MYLNQKKKKQTRFQNCPNLIDASSLSNLRRSTLPYRLSTFASPAPPSNTSRATVAQQISLQIFQSLFAIHMYE
ncbi:unnamed protein product [Lactuca virosa]|uniref:Uncharacterized protein n=1 Tax=Lactuca virosa TaxID=75947 RepID=A0AAU9PEX6_9ASTR|nr:unnamed protein product [Lactuca virosa]